MSRFRQRTTLLFAMWTSSPDRQPTLPVPAPTTERPGTATPPAPGSPPTSRHCRSDCGAGSPAVVGERRQCPHSQLRGDAATPPTFANAWRPATSAPCSQTQTATPVADRHGCSFCRPHRRVGRKVTRSSQRPVAEPQRTLLDAGAGEGSTRRDRRETVSLAAPHALIERESACRTWENLTSSSCSR